MREARVCVRASLLAFCSGRVTPPHLDGPTPPQIQDAVKKVEALDILINNAGVDFTKT